MLATTRFPAFHTRFCQLVFHVLTILLPTLLPSLSPGAVAQGLNEKGLYEIHSMSFEGNSTIGDGEIRAHIVSRETPGFLNKFLYSISERVGRKNEYFNLATFNGDVDRIRRHYRDRGFYDVRVDTSLAFSREENRVGITFLIQEGYRSIIDTLIYKGIVNVPEFVFEDIGSNPKIIHKDPFNRLLVEEEIARVLLILFNAGYPNAVYVKDSSEAKRYYSTRNFMVVLAFDTGKRYRYGNITIMQNIDSLRTSSLRTDITDEIILDNLDYKSGDVYNQASWKSSERNLNRLGVFDQARIEVKVLPEKAESTFVESTVHVRPKDKHELAPELITSDENGSLNLGLGLGYTQRNFFGGARIFSTRLRFRTQTITKVSQSFQVNSDAVSNLDLTFEVLQPYIFSNKTKGNWTFSYIYDKQEPYLQSIFRNRFGFTDRFAEFTTGVLDWTLELVELKKNGDYFPDSTTDPGAQSIINALAANRQFNSILSFTIQRDMTNDLFSPSEGFVHSATFEEAGLFPLALKNVISLPFTQFYRVSLLGRWYNDVSGSRFTILALKLKAGIEEKYGETRSDPERQIPQDHRFYAGGGGSLRGWQSRDLSATGDPKLGGNLALEGSLELRFNILKSARDDFLDKIWLVTFFDFGNVWATASDLQWKGVAIAAGFGFRYNTFFGPFRIDWGFRVYNPGDPSQQNWITQRQLLGQTFKEAILHLGIGHAF